MGKGYCFCCHNCLCLLKAGPEVPADNEACVSRVSFSKRAVADRLQVISVLQLKNHDLYRKGEDKIQSENAAQDSEIHGSSSN
ncbi:hypothetical protein HRI_001742400 [Hibiscus trionum]|uniref:Uncharacterized protein n=1 Tax=Hibiscus trionum TaxID=183268 RepID=A0A9W7HNW9_HIBTR|nr:hypothetical protein HRI_001742400 [Hibiscus trionum]